jgi:hypothetical protein
VSEALVGTGIRLAPSQIKELDRIADSKRVSRNVVILWAIDEYLARFSLPASPSELSDNKMDVQPADVGA